MRLGRKYRADPSGRELLKPVVDGIAESVGTLYKQIDTKEDSFMVRYRPKNLIDYFIYQHLNAYLDHYFTKTGQELPGGQLRAEELFRLG